ncbi:MAG: diacylglycerol/lipid kinase family protein [Christensenellales bacterium]|jgi:diacylglycerol kinase (ATP)
MPEKDIRHFFVFNPAAGKRGARAGLDSALAALPKDSYALHVTNGSGDAAGFVRQTCREERGALRFYACGGDGTLGEVATGALGCERAEIGVWPCGSGNDYVKVYGGEARFLDVAAQMKAASTPVDLIQVGERCAINAVNAGLEAEAAGTMLRHRHRHLFNGKNGYLLGAVDAVIRHMRTPCTVAADGELLHEGDMLTLSLSCGQYIGGGFRCAPYSKNNDGLMDLALIKPISRGRLAGLLPAYKKGEHLDDPRIKDRVIYRQVKSVRIKSDKDIILCLDGEIVTGRDFDIRLLPGTLRFIVP